MSINPHAEAHREHARRADGRFGEQHLAEGNLDEWELDPKNTAALNALPPEFVDAFLYSNGSSVEEVAGSFEPDPHSYAEMGELVGEVAAAIDSQTGTYTRIEQSYDSEVMGAGEFLYVGAGDSDTLRRVSIRDVADWSTGGWEQVASIRAGVLNETRRGEERAHESRRDVVQGLRASGAAAAVHDRDSVADEMFEELEWRARSGNRAAKKLYQEHHNPAGRIQDFLEEGHADSSISATQARIDELIRSDRVATAKSLLEDLLSEGS